MQETREGAQTKNGAMGRAFGETTLLIGEQYFNALHEAITNAQNSVYILMFDWRWYKNDFASEVQILNHALVMRARRGVEVKAITNDNILIDVLNQQGIKARKWNKRELMHAKVFVIDKKFVFLGSHNLTQRALGSNYEISVKIENTALAQYLSDHIERLWSSLIT